MGCVRAWNRVRVTLGVLIVWLWGLGVIAPLSPCWAQSSEVSYGVLIVGDEGDAEMLRVEKILINEMAKQLRNDPASERLPIYSYHFNKERERVYCETKLNVLAEDLLFVGVVTLENKVPLKVVYRIDRIVNAPRAAKDILDRAQELDAGIKETPTPSLPVSPPKTETLPSNEKAPKAPAESSGASSGAPSNSGVSQGAQENFRIQLGSFTSKAYADELKAQAEKAGFSIAVVSTIGADGDPLYKVLSAASMGRPSSDELLARFKAAGFSQAFMIRAPHP